MGRKPISPDLLEGAYYPGDAATDSDDIAQLFETDFPSGRVITEKIGESDDVRTRKLLAELKRLRETLSDYEHIVIQYALKQGIYTQRELAEAQGIGRTQVQQIWRAPVAYSDPSK